MDDNLVGNERLKLGANALDRLSTGLATFGIIAPFAAFTWGGSMILSPQFAIVAMMSWLSAALALHLVAQYLLGGLRDDAI